jgi:hypothetical protein
MKTLFARLALPAALGSLLISIQPVLAQGTAFTYQGRLQNNGSPANGSYNLQFALFNAATNGNQVGGTVTDLAVGVTNGLFTTTLDFGAGIFTGNALWLQIGVETNGDNGNFTLLSALQPLTPAPYAIYSPSAGTATTASGVANGSVTSASIAAGQVVKSLNGLMDAVTLAAGTNIMLTPSGNTLTISSTGSSGSSGSATNAWGLTGNAGTSPANGNFLGTTDNQPVELHVNGVRGMRLEPTVSDGNHSDMVNLVNGSSVNFASPGVYGATISGGGSGFYLGSAYTNSVTGNFGTVGGGGLNTSGSGGTVAGGLLNTSGPYATVGGGDQNTSGGVYSTVAGGTRHIASGPGSVIGGGGYDGTYIFGNTASGGASTVAGGLNNGAINLYDTVGGGNQNTSSGGSSTVGGGIGNTSSQEYATVGGGQNNTSSGESATVGGGYGNTSGPYATVGGGDQNTSGGVYSTVAGGTRHMASGPGSVIGGGGYDGTYILGNTASGGASTVAGGLNNSALYLYDTVGGGRQNTSGGGSSTVAGGYSNSANGPGSVVGGGGYDGTTISGNIASGAACTIAGGLGNVTGNDYATVGGGNNNNANDGSTVGGGVGNSSSGGWATVGGGINNQATNSYATVPGGVDNVAGGLFSLAAGDLAQALHQGAFVWADSQGSPFASTANDQFCIRAQGGVKIDNSTSIDFGNQTRQMLELYRDPTSTYIFGIGVQSSTFYSRTGTNGGFAWYEGGIHNDNQDNAGGGITLMTLDSSGNLRTTTGVIASLSDRNSKSDFQTVNAQDVLARVAALPVMTWRYKTADAAQRHMGPMAQDFYAAFNVGLDDKSICTIDEGGVALAAIQGLNQKVDEKESRIQEQAAEITELKQSVAELKKLVQALAEKK